MTNEQLSEQIQALKELVDIQKQTIAALKAQPPKIQYQHSYPLYTPRGSYPLYNPWGSHIYYTYGGATSGQAGGAITAEFGSGNISGITTQDFAQLGVVR